MATPQVENGFISIATELYEKICSLPISGSEFRVLLFTIRKTYGYKKKEDWISLSQFVKGTGLPRPNVCRTLKELVAKRLLLKSKYAYKPNKNYDEWVVAKRLPSSQTANLGSSQLATHKRNSYKRNMWNKYNENKNQEDLPTVNPDTGKLDKEEKTISRWKDKKSVFILFSPKREPWWIFPKEGEAAIQLFDLKGYMQVAKAVEFQKKYRKEQYCPKINRPSQLAEKWEDLLDFREKTK